MCFSVIFECGVVLFEVAQISSCVGWNVFCLFCFFCFFFMGKGAELIIDPKCIPPLGLFERPDGSKDLDTVCKRKPKLFDCLLYSCLCLLFICFIILVTSLVWTLCLHSLLENDLYDEIFRFDRKITCRLCVSKGVVTVPGLPNLAVPESEMEKATVCVFVFFLIILFLEGGYLHSWLVQSGWALSYILGSMCHVFFLFHQQYWLFNLLQLGHHTEFFSG